MARRCPSPRSPRTRGRGGRVTFTAPAFRSTTLPTSASAIMPARVAFASSRTARHHDPADLEGGRTPVRSSDTTAPGTSRSAAPWATGPAPGRQPGLRSRRQSVRHLQRLARAGSAGLDLPRDARRHARAVRLGHRQRHVDGVRSRRTAVRVEPIRGRRVSRGRRRHARAGRVGSRRRLRHRVRRRRLDVRRRSLGDDLPRARRARDARSRRCRRAWRRSISR